MRYFLDTEYNGFGGELISIGLAPEHGDQDFYARLPLPDRLHPWVEKNVVPYLNMASGMGPAEQSPQAAAEALVDYLRPDRHPTIVADWPDDIAYFCGLLTTGPGEIVEIGALDFQLLSTPGFSTAANSAVPHNALHDARALRSFVLAEEALLAEAPTLIAVPAEGNGRG